VRLGARALSTGRVGTALGGERRYRVLPRSCSPTSPRPLPAAPPRCRRRRRTRLGRARRSRGRRPSTGRLRRAVTRVLTMLDDLAFAPETVAGDGDTCQLRSGCGTAPSWNSPSTTATSSARCISASFRAHSPGCGRP
jgi:hypothetical protein